jgi:hypothetical protein
MSFEAPEEIHFEKPLRSPHLSEDADREYDTLIDQGVGAPSFAWGEVTKKHGVLERTEHEAGQAARRIIEDNRDLPSVAPPQSDESDEQIRQRHRDALKSRGEGLPENYDPELNRRMLEKARRGDFSTPAIEDSSEHQVQ